MSISQLTTQKNGIKRRNFLQAMGAAALLPALFACGGQSSGQATTASSGSWLFSQHGVDNEQINTLLKKALQNGGDYADLYFQHSVGNYLIMEDMQINRAYTQVNLGVGVRVIKGEQVGYAFSQVLEMPAMLEAAHAAALLANVGQTSASGQVYQVPVLQNKPGLNLYPMRIAWDEVDDDERIAILQKVGARMAGADKRVIKTLSQFSDSISQILVATSEGVMRSDLRPRTSLYVSCVAEQNGLRESNYRDFTTRAGLEVYSDERLNILADQALHDTLALFEAKPLKAGQMPCVLAPGSSGILLHEAIGHGLEADFNRRRMSTYAERMGQQIAPPEVTIVDDGTMANSHGAINFDDEGADSQRTVLVERGVLKSYLHDRLSAKFFGVAPTGSGRRQSYEYPPMPRMRATFMEAGNYAPEEIIGSVKNGLYALQFSNGQVNIASGDFSFYVKSGFAIENGKLTHPVKDINVIGSGPEILTRITMVGNDLAFAEGGYTCGKNGQSVPVSQGLPTTLVSGINVGGSHG